MLGSQRGADGSKSFQADVAFSRPGVHLSAAVAGSHQEASSAHYDTSWLLSGASTLGATV